MVVGFSVIVAAVHSDDTAEQDRLESLKEIKYS